MSLIAHKAAGGQMEQVMRLLLTKIRPELHRAINVELGLPWGREDTQQLRMPTTPDGGCGSPSAPEPTKDEISTTTQDTAPVEQVAIAASNPTPTSTSTKDPVPATSEHKPADSELFEETSSLASLDPTLSARIATCLEHLQAGRPLPEGIFRGATRDDLQALDKLYNTLGCMTRGINKCIATINRKVDEKAERYHNTASSRSAEPTAPPSFQGQGNWKTPKVRKKVVWDPDADWDSDNIWSEEEEVRQDAAHKPAIPSKLRDRYIPPEWWSTTLVTPSWKVEETSSWWSENPETSSWETKDDSSW